MIDPLRNVSDTTIIIAAASCLFGWLTGVAFTVAMYWRPITRRAGGELRNLRLGLDDANARTRDMGHRADELARTASEKQATIDAQTMQIGELYKAADRLARQLADAHAALAAARRVA